MAMAAKSHMRRSRPGKSRVADGAPRRDDTRARSELVEKYRTVVEKYEALVKRSAAGVFRRTLPTTLALAAMRASAAGYALFGVGGFMTRNRRWIELSRERGIWKPIDTDAPAPDAATYPNLEAYAQGRARPLLEVGPRVQTGRLALQGTDTTVELRLERLDANGKRVVLAVAEDVTERVQTSREMARAREAVLAHERMRLLGELASGVAHDLNNTLHALSLRIGHLLATPLDGRQRENVDVLARICADAAERVSRLQELGRRREDVPSESFDVARVVDDALAVARPDIDERSHVHGVRIDIETDLAADVRAVGAAAELRHVFVNLLLNARDAMPNGGTILITSRVTQGRAEVIVQDDGTGIRAEDLERVFDPFFTTKGPLGMGLGLAIVEGVMRRLGGSVSAANVPDGGAAFTLTFPLAAALPADPAPPAETTVAAGHRLLVVDDDVDNLEATKYVLEDLGQDADLAASGEEALGLVADGRRYDLVLCDVGMPGMNGWQVAEQVKKLAPDTRVVLVTGWAQEIAPDDPKRRGVDGILGKPLDLAHLRRALNAWLRAPAPAP
jgi:signal transduction histidine kinase/CheY-like chemotaxis protein